MRERTTDTTQGGFTLIEVLAASGTILLALFALAAVLLSTQQAQELSRQRVQVLNRAQSLMEEIKGATPSTIESTYQGTTFPVTVITGTNQDGSVLSVVMNSTDPLILFVTITGGWSVLGDSDTLVLSTQILNSS